MEKKGKTELDAVKNEVYTLNASLRDLGDKKEAQYKEKSLLENKLNKLITQASQLKNSKTEIDTNITELKKKREEKNRAVQEAINDLKKAKRSGRTNKKLLLKRKDLKKQIRDLEFNVQTEVLSFSKEKGLMDKIKEIKKELLELDKLVGDTGEVKKIREQIKATKEEADEFHRQVQTESKKSTEVFQNLTKISKEIADNKKKRSNMRAGLKLLKSQINQVNTVLSKQLGNLGALPRATGRAFMDGARASAEMLHKKTEAVKEKFKKKKKLSREDILLLQREAIDKDKRSKKK